MVQYLIKFKILRNYKNERCAKFVLLLKSAGKKLYIKLVNCIFIFQYLTHNFKEQLIGNHLLLNVSSSIFLQITQ